MRNKQRARAGLTVGGVIVTLAITLLFYPSDLWHLPIQNFDSITHFNYVMRIVDEGFGAALHLMPENTFYPPLFHIISAAFIKFGIVNSVPAGISLAWLLGASIIFPFAMTVLVREIYAYSHHKLPSLAYFFVPVLSSAFQIFPYALLEHGTLYAYGFSFTFIPLLLAISLRLFTLINQLYAKNVNFVQICSKLIKPVLIFMLILALILFSQPRTLFTFGALIAPFAIFWAIELYKTYKKRTFWFFGVIAGVLLLGAGVVGIYVLTHLRNSLILHPERWFPMIKPVLSLPAAIIDFLSCVPISAAGVESGFNFAMLLLVILSLVIGVKYRKKFIASLPLCVGFMLLMLIYVCAYAGDDPVSKIISAAWYKNGFRVSAASPVVLIPLFLISVTVIFPIIKDKFSSKIAKFDTIITRKLPNSIMRSVASFGVITALLIAVLLVNPIAYHMKGEIEKGMSFTDNYWTTELITQDKLDAFEQIKQITPDDALILADPFNGSAFLYSLYGRRVVFPTLNPRLEKGSPMRAVLKGFEKGDITPICEYAKIYNQQHFGKDYASPIYFLSLGASYTIDDPIYKQYNPLHSRDSIMKLTETGKMSLVTMLPNERPLRIFRCE
ncbi:MAG: hypothetical protein LBL41_00560 [Bifidobacteriaceae bacterium]|jgi:hypothetical protein|nr:hypothetical protein [Bifidobacteriaceae bacterium]